MSIAAYQPRSGHVLRWVGAGFCLLLVSGVAAFASSERVTQSGLSAGTRETLALVINLVGLLTPLVLLRHRRAVWVWGWASLVIPLGPVMAWALPRAIRERSSREALQLCVLHGVSVLLWVPRDLRGTTPKTSLLRTITGATGERPEQYSPLNLAGVALLVLLMIAVPVIWGYVRRSRSVLRRTQAESDDRLVVASELSAQVDRQAERENLAREVHDGLGHTLSLINLHAGALALGTQDPRLAESARVVQDHAQRATDDLRSLLSTLREPGQGGNLDPAVTSLSDLDRVLDELAEAGMPLASSVFLQDADGADSVLTHSVYRIVQELLTNARKHAPGQVVRLRVTGGPARGVHIEASNPWAQLGGSPTDGSGLRGIRDRVDVLGGQMELSTEAGRFGVVVRLPWRTEGER